MLYRLLGLGITHRKSTLAFILLISLVMAMGLPRLVTNVSFNRLIAADHPDKAIHARIVREFGSENTTLVYVRDPRLWSPDKLAALERLHQALADLPQVERVDSLFNQRNLRLVAEQLEVRPLMTEAPRDASEITRIRESVASNPLWNGFLLSPDGLSTALHLATKRDFNDREINRKIHQALEGAIAPYKAQFEQVFQVGVPRIRTEMKEGLLSDLKLLLPLSFGLLGLGMLIFLKSGWGVVLPWISGGITILWTFGMMGWAGIPLNLLNGLLPFLVVVINASEVIHLMITYWDTTSIKGEEPRAAVTQVLRRIGVTLVTTVVVSFFAYGSNLFSASSMVRNFALASTFAAVANGVITALLLPMLLDTFRPRIDPPFAVEPPLNRTSFLARIMNPDDHPYSDVILLVVTLTGLFFLYQTTELLVNTDPLASFQPDHPVNREASQIHQQLTGTKSFYVALESDQEKAFLQPRNLEKLFEIQKFLHSQQVFDRSTSIVDLLSLVNQTFHENNPAYAVIPENRELVAQYLLNFHHRDTRRYLSQDLRRATIVVHHHLSDSETLNHHVAELKEAVGEISRGDLTAHVVGENLMINQAAEYLLSSQKKYLVGLLVVIFLVLSTLFTSLKGGAIALINTVFPILVVFGSLAMMGIPLNQGTIVAAAISVAITVNNTIRIISRYNALCRQTGNTTRAMGQTIREEATMILSSGVVLALGFAALAFSHFTILSQFGWLMGGMILLASLGDLILTPILFSRMRLIGFAQILEVTMPPEVMKKSPLFEGMSTYQIRKAILISELREYQAGDLLVEQGSRGRNMFYILTGIVAVRRRQESGSVDLATLASGDVFGEVGYVKEIHRTADVRALSPVQVLVFEHDQLRKNLKYFPRIIANLNFNISRILGERLAEAVSRIEPPEQPLR